MEILNVIAGAPIIATNPWFLLFVVISVLCLAVLFIGGNHLHGAVVAIGVILLAISFVFVVMLPVSVETGEIDPTRYEVRITDPNYIIDATKYKIVEKRDKIIVLEEIK